MANPWFRLHSEFADDPKVQMMSEAQQRRLVMLFCLRSRGESLQTFREAEIGFALRIADTELSETKAEFVSRGFIDDAWNLLNWNKRQYISDSSTERVRKYRQGAKQNETFPKQDETVSVTPPEQNRTETEQIKAESEGSEVLCAEASSAPPAYTLPLLGGKTHGITDEDVVAYHRAFPAIDVEREIYGMDVWLQANPRNLKTKAGIKSFITRWLGKSQNQAGRFPANPSTATPTPPEKNAYQINAERQFARQKQEQEEFASRSPEEVARQQEEFREAMAKRGLVVRSSTDVQPKAPAG